MHTVKTQNQRDERTQAIIDQFAEKNGPCCAGCDYWRWHNSVIGDCTMSRLVSTQERYSFIGITNISITDPGHIPTNRDYVCGNFKNEL